MTAIQKRNAEPMPPPKVYPAAIDQPMILSTDRLGDVFTRNEFS